ncbi:chondroitinase-B domain-containing protein [Arcticibacterium luteifluviistationis]|uniref:Alginate lyase n=1 Tax=Arcticibacterium luteifluviistationis TaxID=1784714 RepID=A0A2Z4G7I6_9BACT|nr:chondroitinase-B domain-containing protein [Arcticibacterium luteifluviistationis]AWV97122.1 alginate lyase [Arcticibacterium luteifluviistationis]
MKNNLLLVLSIVLLFSCSKNSRSEDNHVKNIDELNIAIKQAKPGSEIVLANGIWKDVQIKLYGHGTKEAPITMRAETPGEVFIEGESYLHLGGDFLIVSGLYFRNGHTPSSGIIRYKIGKDSTAFNSRVTECVIEGFTQPSRTKIDRWIEFYGKDNQLDHCYIAGKSNDGVTLLVYHDGNENTNNHHQIVNNYFGPRPRKGGPRGETIRMGDSKTSLSPGRVNVSNNYFEACNGEVEIISDKTAYNSYTNNIFNKCEGSLVLRHANFGTVDGNIFIGGDESNFYGGVRVINAGHWITNNYFYKIRGVEFRSGLAIMNGIPMTPINRYRQVSDAVIAHNTWVDCKSPWQIGVGQNIASAGVLPKSEIRSAAPIRTTIANNLVYNSQEDKTPVINYDDMDGILFKNNIIDNGGSQYSTYDVFKNEKLKMKQVNDWLYVPENTQNQSMDSVFVGFDFGKIDHDLLGDTRAKNNRVGAINKVASAEKFVIDKKKYGPKWFSPEKAITKPNVFTASSAEGDLANNIKKAKSGDIIELSDEVYTIGTSLKIDKEITLRSKGTDKVQLVFKVPTNSPAFEMNPKGVLRLDNLDIKGENSSLAFGILEQNMSSAYNLFIDNCVIEDFGHILKATKGSFADSISVSNTTIQNCDNGFTLAAEEKGNYNAEMVTFVNCKFINVKSDVINFYRGGYDESTIGGFLTLSKNTFTSCGGKDKTGTLIKTPGIINVLISGNIFKNNPVKLVALLWGEKNNHELNNTIERSGQMKVEQQRKLDLMY